MWLLIHAGVEFIKPWCETHQWTGSLLVQAKPHPGTMRIPEPMMTYCHPYEQTVNKNTTIFIKGNAFQYIVSKMSAILFRHQCLKFSVMVSSTLWWLFIGVPCQRPVSQRVYEHIIQNSSNSCCSKSRNNDLISSKFCTSHDSWAVMTCAKLWPDYTNEMEIEIKRIFRRFQ